MSDRRFLFLVVGVLLILAVLTAISVSSANRADKNEYIPIRSVYNTKPSGYRAWQLVMEKSGQPVIVWRKPFDKLPEIKAPATMLVIEPHTTAGTKVIFGREQVDKLLDWVEEGNTLIVLDEFNRRSSEYLLQKADLESVGTVYNQKPSRIRPVAGNPDTGKLMRHVRRELYSQSYYRLQGGTDATALLEDDAHHPVLMRQDYGDGTLYVGVLEDIASNRYVADTRLDNFQLLANLVGMGDGPVIVNEYVHGYGESTSLLEYYLKTPLGQVMQQLVFLFIMLLWLSFMRWRPVLRPAAIADSTGMKEFVTSMAGIYQRSQAASLVIAPLLSEIEQLLMRQYRLRLEETPKVQELLDRLFGRYSEQESGRAGRREIGKVADHPAAWLEKARTVVAAEKRLPSGEVLKLTQQLTLIQERLGAHAWKIPASSR